MKHRVVIHSYRPWLRWLVLGSAALLVVVLGAVLYQWARSDALLDWRNAQARHAAMLAQQRDLEQQIQQLTQNNTKLREQLVYLERSIEIDRQACAEVKTTLKSLQGDLSLAREQLAFYRGIVSPEESRAGVRLFEMTLRQAPQGQTYLYDLVLVQSVRHERRMRGTVNVTISGFINGEIAEYPLEKLSLGDSKTLTYSFRYFQEFSGELKLPDGFQPERVQVSILPRSGRANVVQNTYDWKELLGS